MSLWKCASCGCPAVADSLTLCPHCYVPRATEPVVDEPADTPVTESESDVTDA